MDTTVNSNAERYNNFTKPLRMNEQRKSQLHFGNELSSTLLHEFYDKVCMIFLRVLKAAILIEIFAARQKTLYSQNLSLNLLKHQFSHKKLTFFNNDTKYAKQKKSRRTQFSSYVANETSLI